MPEDDSIDRESLTSNTVAKLREICKERGLHVSGKKSVLVDRILEDEGLEENTDETTEEESWEGEDALVVDEDPLDTRDKVDEVLSRIGKVVEAEVVEAELVAPAPEESSKSPEPVILGEDDQPSLVIYSRLS